MATEEDYEAGNLTGAALRISGKPGIKEYEAL